MESLVKSCIKGGFKLQVQKFSNTFWSSQIWNTKQNVSVVLVIKADFISLGICYSSVIHPFTRKLVFVYGQTEVFQEFHSSLFTTHLSVSYIHSFFIVLYKNLQISRIGDDFFGFILHFTILMIQKQRTSNFISTASGLYLWRILINFNSRLKRSL